MQPLKRLAFLTQSAWLLDMLAEERLTSHFQPIVRADEPGEIFAHECLLCGVDTEGDLVSPKRIFDVAADSNLLFQLDLSARRAAIRSAARHRIQSRVFVNFTPTAIYDPTYCLRSTVASVQEAGIRNEDVVFEVVESDKTLDVAHLNSILNYYRSHGFQVALDDIGAGYSSLNLIHQLRPDFIKLDMELVRGVDADPYKALVASKLLEIAQGLGIRTVAEGVETREELACVREHGADYVQGYLIARPAPAPVHSLRPVTR